MSKFDLPWTVVSVEFDRSMLSKASQRILWTYTLASVLSAIKNALNQETGASLLQWIPCACMSVTQKLLSSSNSPSSGWKAPKVHFGLKWIIVLEFYLWKWIIGWCVRHFWCHGRSYKYRRSSGSVNDTCFVGIHSTLKILKKDVSKQARQSTRVLQWFERNKVTSSCCQQAWFKGAEKSEMRNKIDLRAQLVTTMHLRESRAIMCIGVET